MFGKADL